MVFDAGQLWWPPFLRLYNQLETLKLEPSAVSAAALSATLAEYEPWLVRGAAAGFCPPSEASRRALDSEPSLSIAGKKLPVEAGLRAAAADVSHMLHLDEVQAYILLRRWVAKAGAGALAAAAAAPGGAATLAPHQRQELAQMYYSERLYLLKAIEGLLWEGERAVGGPLLDVIEGSLSKLLEQHLEDSTFQALQANLAPAGTGGAASSAPAPSAAAAAGAAAAPFAIASFRPTGGGGGTGPAAASAASIGDGRAQAAALERCCLLNILILIYYHPRKQCTPDRFLSLAQLFHTRLFTSARPRFAASGGGGNALDGSDGEPSPAQMSVKLATVLLLEMLDVDKVLTALASGQAIADEASYVFAAPAVKQRVNAELASWWSSASSSHSPVLLAWAAVQCLIGKDADGSGAGGAGTGEWEGHASKAHETDALGTLCQLTTHVALQPNAAEMFNNIVLSTMSAAFCAFDFSPLAMPLRQAEVVVRIMGNLFRDQPALCESFWAGDRLTDDPLRHFRDELRALYPAYPTLLHTLLAALSSTADTAAAANAYLAQLSSLACLHVLPDAGIEEGCNEEGEAYTRYPIPLPGSRALTLPQGILGEVVPLPESFAAADAGPLLLLAAGGADIERVQLVRWRLELPDGIGQWILLCRLSEALALVQRCVPAGGPAGASDAALHEVAASFQLLATLCTRDPHTALDLLHLELPTGAEQVESGGQRGPDLLSMTCQAVAVLAALPKPPTPIIGDCLAVCAALAEGIPGRVVQELLSLCGISPTAAAAAGGAAAAAASAMGQVAEVPLLGRLLDVEGAAGRYPATQAFLRLLTTLVSAASPAPALHVLVVWVLHRVLAEHRHWRYCLRAERWRLAGLSLRLVRLALLSAPTSPPAAAAAAAGAAGAQQAQAAAAVAEEGGSVIAAAVAEVLRYGVGMRECLLAALPHHAQQLERNGQESRYVDEAAAVEDCCIEWHRLLPALLPAASPESRLAPAAFFRPCPAAGGGGANGSDPSGGGGASSAAAVLLSYISYPYFGSSERALVMRSMHCLAAAAAAAAPGAVFAVLLPQESPEAGVASAARAAIAAAFSPQAAAATPQLLLAACDALVAAVQYHPSLLDALLFPCGLEQALLDKENKSGNAEAAGGTGGAKPAAAAAAAAVGAAPRSCLDALWELLQQRERLQKEQPAVLAKLLQVLSAFWQSSGAAFRAVAVLQRQAGMWGHICGLLEAAGQAGPLDLPAVPSGEPAAAGGSGTAGTAAAAWADQEPAAALVAAEAFALQVVAAECYTCGGGSSSTSSTTGMPAELAAFLRRLPADLVPRLLQRYSLPLPTASLLGGAQQAAAAAGLQLLGAALSDETLWRSMAEGSSLAPQLAAAAQPLLRQFGSQAEAARVLGDSAPAIAARNFRSQPSAVAMAQLVMRQAEVPERLACDREFGAVFVYDSALLGRRLGSVLLQQLDQVQQLSGWLEAASVAASLEDARLAAVTALKALLTAAHKQRPPAPGGGGSSGSSSSSVPAAAVQSALGVLGDALRDMARSARGGSSSGSSAADMAAAAAAEAAAVDAVGVHLCNGAEAAYILLLLAQRWSAGAAAAGAAGGGEAAAAAAQLCSGVLQATGEWLEALDGMDTRNLSSSPDAQPAADAITHSLLAAALVLLPTAPGGAEAAGQLDQHQLRLQATATQLLPSLLAACHRQPPQLVLVVSLATALIDRLVPPAAWLPLVRSHLHFGDLLHSMLVSLHSAAQQQGAAAAAHAASSVPGAAAGAAAAAAPPGALPSSSSSSSSPLAAASVEEAALLLALQVAQARSGAELLLEQGAVAHALALGKWLLVREGGNLMGETPQQQQQRQRGGGGGGHRHLIMGGGASSATPAGASGGTAVVDYSNAYRQDGSPNPAHRLWCCLLSLMAVLLAALPGHAAVEEAALQLAIEAEPRLLLATEPPAASPQQPLTLAMAQEAKYALFFLCGLARLSGQWRMLLPDSLPAFRRAAAAFLDFAAAPGSEPISCGPVSPAERAAARADATSSTVGGGGGSDAAAAATGGALRLGKGWFGAAAAAAAAAPGARQASGAAPAGGYVWQLAERLYSGVLYALAFQLALAPEVGEEELAELGPEWVTPATLLALQEDAMAVAYACCTAAAAGATAPGGAAAAAARGGGGVHPAAWRLARCLQAVLGLSTQLQDGMGAERGHGHKQAVAEAIARLAGSGGGAAGRRA